MISDVLMFLTFEVVSHKFTQKHECELNDDVTFILEILTSGDFCNYKFLCVHETDVRFSPLLWVLNAELTGINATEFKEAFDVVFAKRKTKQKSWNGLSHLCLTGLLVFRL